jgi:hypothetical protein
MSYGASSSYVCTSTVRPCGDLPSKPVDAVKKLKETYEKSWEEEFPTCEDFENAQDTIKAAVKEKLIEKMKHEMRQIFLKQGTPSTFYFTVDGTPECTVLMEDILDNEGQILVDITKWFLDLLKEKVYPVHAVHAKHSNVYTRPTSYLRGYEYESVRITIDIE